MNRVEHFSDELKVVLNEKNLICCKKKKCCKKFKKKGYYCKKCPKC